MKREEAWHGHRQDRCACSASEKSHTGLCQRHFTAALTPTLREDTYHFALFQNLQRPVKTPLICLSSLDRKGPAHAQKPTHGRKPIGAGAGQEHDLPGEKSSQEESVEGMKVIGGQDQGAC